MTTPDDDLPLADEFTEEPFCQRCGGSGMELDGSRCPACGGSGEAPDAD